MNLGQNNTLDQLFENSEPTIKRDLCLTWEPNNAGALSILNRNIERLERERYAGAFTEAINGPTGPLAKDPLVGLVNNPRFARGGSGGGKRAAIALALAMAELGCALKDVVVIGSGGRIGHFDYAVFDECSHFDNNLSAHPGERHRQLSRKLTSRRSRAGKAGRWA